MENLSTALRHVSQAIDLDSNGFQQAAFAKYLQSLQVLVLYLNSFYALAGFQKMLLKKNEVVQVLSMIHECSDRILVILNEHGNLLNDPLANHSKYNANAENKFSTSKIPEFEKLQNQNKQLLKLYKLRLEKATDKYTKTNLTLEFQRRLSENAVLAKNKYDLTVKKLQKERVQLMENAIRKLFENSDQLNQKEKEKRELYHKVLLYVKTEIWPVSWKLNSYELTTLEIVEKVFFKIIRCCEHPLTQWLILIQTNIKRKIDSVLKDYNEYVQFFPDMNSESNLNYSIEENDDNIDIKFLQSDISVPSIRKKTLEGTLDALTSEIRNIIEDTMEIFYLVYKSLLPEESEALCYHIIEKHFLKPFWPNLFTLFRIANLPTEIKISKTMFYYNSCSPSDFGNIDYSYNTEVQEDLIAMLKNMQLQHSIIYKLKTLVHVSQKICECDVIENSSQRKLGTDDMLPLLSYIIVQSNLPELVSESDMLEHLFDMRYMLGEEGFALSSFQTALKYIEIKI